MTTRSLPTFLGDNEARIVTELLRRYCDLPLVERASLLARFSRELRGEPLGHDTALAALSTDVALDDFDATAQ